MFYWFETVKFCGMLFKKGKLMRILLALLIGLGLIFPAMAEPFSFEVGVGAVSLPEIDFTHHLRAAYRLPLLPPEHQLDAVLSLTTAPLFLSVDQLFLSGRYLWTPPQGWQPYVLAGVGWMPLRRGEWGLQLGGGVNQWFNENWGLSYNASLSLPPAQMNLLTINADISLKYSL